jgi:hypothetical protein
MIDWWSLEGIECDKWLIGGVLEGIECDKWLIDGLLEGIECDKWLIGGVLEGIECSVLGEREWGAWTASCRSMFSCTLRRAS